MATPPAAETNVSTSEAPAPRASSRARRDAHAGERYQPTEGPRADALSVVALTALAFFVALILLLLLSDVVYLALSRISSGDVRDILASPALVSGVRLSVITSSITLLLVMLVAVPVGYALSRYRFPGHAVLNAVVDVPIVLPPVVLGLSLLAFFGTPLGGWLRDLLRSADLSLVSAGGIVLCQFLVSVSYCIRATKASFDAVDRRLEHVALSLGCSRWGAFRRVTLPLARGGLVAGGVMAWARAIGVFGPLMVFVGTSPRVQVMPTSMWLELSVGNVEISLTVALIATLMAGTALAFVHWLLPGRKWV